MNPKSSKKALFHNDVRIHTPTPKRNMSLKGRISVSFEDKYMGESALESWGSLFFNKNIFGQQVLTSVD